MSLALEQPPELGTEVEVLRARLAEAEETLEAIRRGEVDALVVSGSQGEQLYTLQNTADPYRILIEQMNEGAATLSESGVVLHCNRRFAELLQQPLERVIGSAVAGFVLRTQRRLWQGLLQTGLHGRAAREILLSTAAGNLVPAQLAVNRLPGEPARVSLVASDLSETRKRETALLNLMEDLSVSKRELEQLNGALHKEIQERQCAENELKNAHARLRRFVDANLVGVVLAHASGRVIEANDYYLRLIGCSRAEFDRGEVNWRAITPPAWLPIDEQALRELDRSGTCAPYEKEYLRRDGTRVPVLLANALLPGPQQEIMAFVLDLTPQKQAEKEIRELNADLDRRVRERTAELEAAMRELDAFAYSVSHDLRAPLRSIDGFSRVLLEDYQDRLDAEGVENLQTVRSATQRMGQLIDDLLELSRVTRSPLQRSQVDLSELAAEIIKQLRRDQPERELTLCLTPGLRVEADPNLMRIVLENLLGNAWKFTGRQAHPVIEMGSTLQEGKPVFFIRDNGAGFDMAYARKLFGAFQRLHDASEFAGTGIGLATVQRIMLRHGGRIWAQAQVGQGATFFFSLAQSTPGTL